VKTSFQNTVAGIIILGVISSLIGSYIWERGIRPINLWDAWGVAKPQGSATAVRTPGGTQTNKPQQTPVSHRCTFINGRDYSARVIVPSKGWTHLNRGEAADGYVFSLEGTLQYDGEMVTHSIPVTAISGRGEAEWIYAQSVKISPTIPGGQYALLQACEQPNSQGPCWAVFVVHLDTHRIERTSVGHYGIHGDSVAWIRADDEYAVVRYEEGGQSMHFRIHLPTGQSTPCDSSSY
jgi:hypothetical protein